MTPCNLGEPKPRSPDLVFGADAVDSRARKLHKRLHTHCTFDAEQVHLNAKA